MHDFRRCCPDTDFSAQPTLKPRITLGSNGNTGSGGMDGSFTSNGMTGSPYGANQMHMSSPSHGGGAPFHPHHSPHSQYNGAGGMPSPSGGHYNHGGAMNGSGYDASDASHYNGSSHQSMGYDSYRASPNHHSANEQYYSSGAEPEPLTGLLSLKSTPVTSPLKPTALKAGMYRGNNSLRLCCAVCGDLISPVSALDSRRSIVRSLSGVHSGPVPSHHNRRHIKRYSRCGHITLVRFVRI